MNTNEPEKEVAGLPDSVFQTVVPNSEHATPAGLPEPDVLARMANEFFKAMPGYGPAHQSVPESLSLTSMPTEAQLSAFPVTLMETAISQQPALTSQPSLPEIPGGVHPSNFSPAVSFSFLDDVRPLFSYPAASPLPVVPAPATIKIPAEAELRAIADQFLSSATPKIPASEAQLVARRVSGPAAQPGASELPVAYSFINEIRQLAAMGPVRDPADALQGLTLSSQPFDVQAVRRDFPILEERVHGKPLIWLDNAATTQKPRSVIERLSRFYARENSNIHRAAHELAARATDAYEAAREKTRRFLNASTVREIVFVRGATEGINLVAQSWGRQNIQKDDEIVITWLEHHANIVPWQMLCAGKGARLRVAPVDDHGQILLNEYQKLLGPRTRLVALAQVSNALGTVTPAEEMIEMAHRYGALVLLDGAQAVSHMRVDMQAYDCDFYVFSGHKVFAPTGIGVVYSKSAVLENTPPWHGGGNMIQDVTFEKTTYQPPPGRFEAGTGNIADAVGLGAAIDYLDRVGMVNVSRYEHDLLSYATDALLRIPGLRLIGTAREKAGVLSFVLDGFRTEDVGAALNRQGIAVRAGHHCAQPILRRFGVESTVRPSLALYNTCEEIDALAAAIWNLKTGHGSL
ncbi:MAG: SufS family cysteine desulfurase [Acidobacteria bacterium]|nr:SufS family cysteine desulfurase [Acidobacteriota bacterium]